MKYYMMAAGVIFAGLSFTDFPDASVTASTCTLIALIIEIFKVDRLT